MATQPIVDVETIEKPTRENDKPLVMRDERGRLLPGSSLRSQRALVRQDRFTQYKDAFLNAISPLQMQHLLKGIYREAYDVDAGKVKNLKAANMLLSLAFGKQALVQIQNNISTDALLKIVDAAVIDQI